MEKKKRNQEFTLESGSSQFSKDHMSGTSPSVSVLSKNDHPLWLNCIAGKKCTVHLTVSYKFLFGCWPTLALKLHKTFKIRQR